MIPVMAPLAPTVAVAVAPSPLPVIVIGASGVVVGLKTQFGQGPK